MEVMTKTPERILISHVYSSDNKGDAALLSVLIQDIERQYGSSVQIDMLTIDDITPGETFDARPLYPAFMYWALNRFKSRPLKLLYSCYMMALTLLWAWGYRLLDVDIPIPRALRTICRQYRDSDMIITVGGGYFRSDRSFVSMVNLWLMLHPLTFARIINRPTFLYTMSVGPFARRIEKRKIKRIFKKLPLIILRENKSVRLLRMLGVKKNTMRSVDSGFLFQSKRPYPLKKQLGIAASRTLVGVTVRRWLDSEAQQKYEQAVAGALDTLIRDHQVEVVFIPQVTSTFNDDDDRMISRSVYERMEQQAHAHVVTDAPDHYQVKAMYDQLDMILGTRFHSVIFSLTSYVPAIAVEYEHKTSGIMQDLELENWSIKIEDVTAEQLNKLFDALLKEKTAYKKHLKTTLPGYVDQAKQAIVEVDVAYQDFLRRNT